MFKRLLYFIAIGGLIAGTTAAVIYYAKGYRLNVEQKSLTSTGIISASSYPDKASIYIDGKLTAATSASINLPPKWYGVKISKDGYQAWEKEIEVKKEEVSTIDALLIPKNPSLRALNSTGVTKPVLSPSRTKVAFIVPYNPSSPSAELTPKSGIYILSIGGGPLGGSGETKQIYETARRFDFENSVFNFSSDEKELMITFYTQDKKSPVVSSAMLLKTDTLNTIYTEVGPTRQLLLDKWGAQAKEKEKPAYDALNQKLSSFLLSNTSDIRFSLDDTKILYHATVSASLDTIIDPPLAGRNSTDEVRSITPGSYYVYDIKEDRNYFIADSKTIPDSVSIMWYSDSKHVITVEDKAIYMSDYDNTNKRLVYAGPFEHDFVFVFLSGERVGIMTNLNNPQNLPNFYELDLR